MKFWSIITLMVFVNFTVLPGIATWLGWEIPTANVMVNEEETHSSVVTFEKTIPETLSVHQFIKFFESDIENGNFILRDDSIHLSPYLSIFSPPPEA